MREIKILKQLQNKNVVPLIDIAVDRGKDQQNEVLS
jgi:hypothetical protein